MHVRRRSFAFALVALFAINGAVTAAPPGGGGGKPGYPDRVTWGGASWQVKSSRSAVGPGPNVFSAANVSVDPNDALHLRIDRNASGTWTTAEVIGPTSFGYGTYTFTLASAVHDLDPNVVLGLFTWSDKAPYAHREMDVEFARWGSATDPNNAQFVVQPAGTAGHLHRFTQPDYSTSVHSFTWEPGRVSFASRASAGAAPYATFVYTGTDVPKPGDERVRLNLWLFGGRPPTDGQPVEVVISSFAHTPLS